jgi:alanine dehydrogenase
MKVGVVKEIKNKEHRVALTPAGATALREAGHDVRVEERAGSGSGFTDAEYRESGAEIVGAAEAWNSDLVIKVKEPLESEYPRLRGQIVFTYFHLAGVAPSLTRALLDTETTAVAYETVEDRNGRLPLLAPMSAVAGSMAPVVGSHYLAKFNEGSGVLPGEIMGRRYGKVLIVGDGVVGRHAARVACAMRTEVVIVGRNPARAASLEKEISPDLRYVLSAKESIARELLDSDILVGAVLVKGGRAAHLVSRRTVETMRKGSVIVDVCIDQGGCVETSRPTTHSDPVYVECGVTHYCVTNMPGAYPRTSTYALTEATLPYALAIANGGIEALREDSGLARGLNTYRGFVTCRPVAEALDLSDRHRAFADFSPDS